MFHLAHQWSLLQFEEFLDGFSSDTATERLYYFHSTLPHPPYIYDATGKPGSPAYYVTRRHDPASLLPIAKTAEEMRLRYEEQSQYADSLLGRLIQRLRTEDLYEQATIIVTSDHGDRFGTIATQGESPRYGATGTSARIPLVIKSPSLRPQVLSVEYQHIDFSNTLLDVLGLPQDHDADGVSAFASQRPTREKVFYIGSARYVYDPQGQTWRRSASEAQGTGAGVR